MKRIKDETGVVHFTGHLKCALCGCLDTDLIGHVIVMPETSDRVTCTHCARIYCQIKNAPWNEVDDATMDAAIYSAVREEDDNAGA